jgi:endonuclease III
VIAYLVSLVEQNEVASKVLDHETMIELLLFLLKQPGVPDPHRLLWLKDIVVKDGCFPLQVAVILAISSSTSDAQAITAGLSLVNDPRFSLDWVRHLPLDELEDIIRIAGRQQMNARNIRGIAHMIAVDFAGKFPAEPEKMMKLPGIGPKSAFIIQKTCFGVVGGIPCDLHVIKFSVAMGFVSPNMTDNEVVRVCLEGWVPYVFWEEFNEVYGCLGQLFRQKAVTDTIRRAVSKPQFSLVRERVLRILSDYSRNKRPRENS